MHQIHLSEQTYQQSLTADVLPSLTLSQVYAALSYYHDHQTEIDDILAQNSETSARAYLRETLGEKGYRRITLLA